MKVEFIFKWFDFWIGMFWDSKKKYLYILPIPMCGIILKFEKTCKPCMSKCYCADRNLCQIKQYKKGLIDKPWWYNHS